MVLGKRINTKKFFLMQQLSFESVPDISLPPCIQGADDKLGQFLSQDI
jgi:hypothetical protein